MQPEPDLFGSPGDVGRRLYVSVAVPAMACGLFTYTVPESAGVQPGSRLEVSFSGRTLTGVCVRIRKEKPAGFEGRILPVLRIIDSSPVMDGDVISLCLFISGYYHAPEGEIF